MNKTSPQADIRHGASGREPLRSASAVGFKRLALPAVAAAVQIIGSSQPHHAASHESATPLRKEGAR